MNNAESSVRRLWLCYLHRVVVDVLQCRLDIEQTRLLVLNAANELDLYGNKVAKGAIAMAKVCLTLWLWLLLACVLGILMKSSDLRWFSGYVSCKQLALLLKCAFKGFLLLVNILSTGYPSPLIWLWGLVMLSWMWRLQPQTQHYWYWTMPFKSMEQGVWALTFHYLICGHVHGLYVLQMAQMRYIWAPLPSLSCSGYPNFRPAWQIETLSCVMTLFTWSYTASVFSSTTPEKYLAPISMQKGRGLYQCKKVGANVTLVHWITICCLPDIW
jgi:hypothetical protein